MLTAVGTHDPLGPAAVAAWREAIGPGMDYLKSKVAKAGYIAT